MHLVIFKAPRTGSTSLAKALNATPSVACAGEALNHLPDGESAQVHIDRLMSAADASGKAHVGFTVNPAKHDLDPDFYKPPPKRLAGGFAVVLLERVQVAQAALSSWVARRAGRYPGNKRSRDYLLLEQIIKERPIVPRDELRALLAHTSKRQVRIRDFAARFAAANASDVTTLTYERLYHPPHADIDLVDRILGVSIDQTALSPDAKILPPPAEWIANFSELEDLFQPGNQTIVGEKLH